MCLPLGAWSDKQTLGQIGLRGYENAIFSMALLFAKYFVCGLMVRQSWVYSQNLILNYPLVVFHSQRCHIRTNANYWSAIIISTQKLVFNKLLVIVVVPNARQRNWLYNQYQNVTVFLPKALPSFFKNTVKIKNLAAIRIRQILEDFFWRLYTFHS